MGLVFDEHAFEDLAWWMSTDVKKARKVIALIQEVRRTPFVGRGKPEPLKHELAGCWSRRIDERHRLVYEPRGNDIRILSCRFHYDDK
jgi:toxin YoeB